ncbi:universal stress protein (plasmid) [Acaryochloris sp. 'Moss Beach']|uniref:universal stress protein n=1 Tax=Acaryochloris TaxID=155977 RepID=UPI001BAF1E86|nr:MULTISPECIES: universal stress protein [Acaryochloris]QUY46075.1 universal stress protein [Acaryochloris marina S15]UJB72593.1 universal stress protein [Acaryochloris sp. 'Moss Beach']
MSKKILVALDHSAFSQQTFMQSVVLAKATHAKLLLLHVISSTEEGYPPYPLMPGVLEEFDLSHTGVVNSYLNDLDVFKASSLELLRSRANQAKEKGLTVVYQQSLGDPGREICEIARQWQADTIIIGRRSRNFLSKLLLGSVSNYVTHNAPCSVLIVHHQDVPEFIPKQSINTLAANQQSSEAWREKLSYRSILVAMDGSAINPQIFNMAINVAKSMSTARLMLLHVLPPDIAKVPISITHPTAFTQQRLDDYPSLRDDILYSQQRQWNTYDSDCLPQLRSYTAIAREAGIPTEFIQQPGSPGEIICEFAKNRSSDLILVGNRGRSGLSEMLLGSVGKYVANHASCSVMVVRPQQPA